MTWQLGAEGLAYLARHGVRAEKGLDHVSSTLLQELKLRKLIWSGGGGVGTDSLPPPRLSTATLEALATWAMAGKPSELRPILSGHGIAPLQVFSGAFLTWHERLSEREPLLAVRELSLPDCEALWRQPGNAPPAGICEQIASAQNGSRILWQFLRLAAQVYGQINTEANYPSAWQNTVLNDLWSLIENRRAEGPLPIPGIRPPRPYVLWDTVDETVRAVLPAHRLPTGRALSWAVNDEPQEYPTSTGGGSTHFGETRSRALEPRERYAIRVSLSGEDAYDAESVFSRPGGGKPYVLFDGKGRLIPLGGDTLQAGDYLALAPPKEDSETPLLLPGVTVLDDEEFEPVGWWNWRPYRIRVSAGADLGPYGTVNEGDRVAWRLDVDKPPVTLLNVDDVVFGGWPRISISASDRRILDGAWLEVSADHHSSVVKRLNLRECIAPEGDSAGQPASAGALAIDFASADCLQDLWGNICLRLYVVADADIRLPSLRFLRCPAADLAYVQDPVRPQAAMGVAVSGPGAAAASAHEGSVAVESDEVSVFRAEDPAASPMVSIAFPEEAAVLRIRIPVARGRVVRRGSRPERWQELPVRVNLSRCGLDDRLRLEFVDDPDLLQGELFCRLLGGDPVAAGKATGIPRTYDVPLHRWRDHLGVYVQGAVLVRCASELVEVATLEAKSTPPQPVVIDTTDALTGACGELAKAAGHVSASELRRLALRCAEEANGSDSPNALREICLIAASKALLYAAPLDLAARTIQGLASGKSPEEVVLGAILRLRQGTSSDQELDLIARQVRTTPECSLKQCWMAEYAYRLARPRCSVASLQASQRSLSEVRWSSQLDALGVGLLDSIVSFLLGQPRTVPTCRNTDSWPLSADAARSYLSLPLGEYSATIIGPPDEPPPSAWYVADSRFVRALVLQSLGDIRRAADALGQLADYTEAQLPGIGLARARQLRIEGELAAARDEYMQIHRGRWRGHELVMGELPSA